VNKSEGLRYLARLLRGALEMYVEYSDPVDPVLFKRTSERLKYGSVLVGAIRSVGKRRLCSLQARQPHDRIHENS
jgi:hypothetical protein